MKYLLILTIIQFLFILAINSTTNVNNELLGKVRTGFAELAKNSTDFDPKDVERVKSDPEFLEPYVTKSNDSAVVLRNLVQRLKRNNEIGLNNLTDVSFPKSIYQLGYIGLLGKDRDGRQILIIRAKAWKKSPEIYKLMLSFILYVFNKVDMKRPSYPGALIIIDHTGVEVDNVDAGLDQAVIDSIEQSSRNSTLVLLVESPALLKSGFLTMLNALQQRFKVIKADELPLFIEPSGIPKWLNGTLDCDLTAPPPGVN